MKNIMKNMLLFSILFFSCFFVNIDIVSASTSDFPEYHTNDYSVYWTDDMSAALDDFKQYILQGLPCASDKYYCRRLDGSYQSFSYWSNKFTFRNYILYYGTDNLIHLTLTSSIVCGHYIVINDTMVQVAQAGDFNSPTSVCGIDFVYDSSGKCFRYFGHNGFYESNENSGYSFTVTSVYAATLSYSTNVYGDDGTIMFRVPDAGADDTGSSDDSDGGLLSVITDFFSGFFDNLGNLLSSLFIPSDDFMEASFEDLKSSVKARFSADAWDDITDMLSTENGASASLAGWENLFTLKYFHFGGKTYGTVVHGKPATMGKFTLFDSHLDKIRAFVRVFLSCLLILGDIGFATWLLRKSSAGGSGSSSNKGGD